MRRLKLYTDPDGEVFYLENILRLLNNVSSGGFFPSIYSFHEDCQRYFFHIKNNRNIHARAGHHSPHRDSHRDSNRDRRDNTPVIIIRHNQNNQNSNQNNNNNNQNNQNNQNQNNHNNNHNNNQNNQNNNHNQNNHNNNQVPKNSVAAAILLAQKEAKAALIAASKDDFGNTIISIFIINFCILTFVR